MLERVAARFGGGGYYLAGGTSLALQAGHRRSEDLDFFVQVPGLALPAPRELDAFLRAQPRCRIRAADRGTRHADADGVHLSFLATPYPLIRPLRRAGRARLAHPVDLGLMKLAAIIARGSRKDFMDLAWIVRHAASLRTLLKYAPKKFGPHAGFAALAFRALVYFDDAEREETDPVTLSPDMRWDRVKRVIEDEVRRTFPSTR